MLYLATLPEKEANPRSQPPLASAASVAPLVPGYRWDRDKARSPPPRQRPAERGRSPPPPRRPVTPVTSKYMSPIGT